MIPGNRGFIIPPVLYLLFLSHGLDTNYSIVAHLYALQCLHISASFRTRLYPSHLHLQPLSLLFHLASCVPFDSPFGMPCRAVRAGGQTKGVHEAGGTNMI